MPRHLTLPQTAYEDVRALLRLDREKLCVLGELFGTRESITPRKGEFIQDLTGRLDLDVPTAESIALVCQFLLTVVERGHPAGEILQDVREFVSRYATEEDADIIATLDSKRQLLEDLLTPKAARSRALKVEFLSHGLHTVAESFRSVCELRPVFECPEGTTSIVGLVPVIFLTASLSDPSGGSSTACFQVTPEGLDQLQNVIQRAKEKLEAVRRRFRDDLIEN